MNPNLLLPGDRPGEVAHAAGAFWPPAFVSPVLAAAAAAGGLPYGEALARGGPAGPRPGGAHPAEAAGPATKIRKPYTITKQRERWSDEEHQRFLEALKLYGRAWRRIEEHIGSKTAVQIRSHAQKFFSKVEREGPGAAGSSGAGGATAASAEDISIPPPRPKRKPQHPYPRKAHEPPAAAAAAQAAYGGKPDQSAVAAIASAASAAAAAAAAAVAAAAADGSGLAGLPHAFFHAFRPPPLPAGLLPATMGPAGGVVTPKGSIVTPTALKVNAQWLPGAASMRSSMGSGDFQQGPVRGSSMGPLTEGPTSSGGAPASRETSDGRADSQGASLENDDAPSNGSGSTGATGANDGAVAATRSPAGLSLGHAVSTPHGSRGPSVEPAGSRAAHGSRGESLPPRLNPGFAVPGGPSSSFARWGSPALAPAWPGMLPPALFRGAMGGPHDAGGASAAAVAAATAALAASNDPAVAAMAAAAALFGANVGLPGAGFGSFDHPGHVMHPAMVAALTAGTREMFPGVTAAAAAAASAAVQQQAQQAAAVAAAVHAQAAAQAHRASAASVAAPPPVPAAMMILNAAAPPAAAVPVPAAAAAAAAPVAVSLHQARGAQRRAERASKLRELKARWMGGTTGASSPTKPVGGSDRGAPSSQPQRRSASGDGGGMWASRGDGGSGHSGELEAGPSSGNRSGSASGGSGASGSEDRELSPHGSESGEDRMGSAEGPESPTAKEPSPVLGSGSGSGSGNGSGSEGNKNGQGSSGDGSGNGATGANGGGSSGQGNSGSEEGNLRSSEEKEEEPTNWSKHGMSMASAPDNNSGPQTVAGAAGGPGGAAAGGGPVASNPPAAPAAEPAAPSHHGGQAGADAKSAAAPPAAATAPAPTPSKSANGPAGGVDAQAAWYARGGGGGGGSSGHHHFIEVSGEGRSAFNALFTRGGALPKVFSPMRPATGAEAAAPAEAAAAPAFGDAAGANWGRPESQEGGGSGAFLPYQKAGLSNGPAAKRHAGIGEDDKPARS